MIVLLVALGGALGAMARFFVDGELKSRAWMRWPIGTFVINVSGSFILGALDAAHPSADVAALLVTGFCGGFTTFSTAMLDVIEQLRANARQGALLYLFGTLVSCIFACWLGLQL